MYNHLTLQMYDPTLTALAGYVGTAERTHHHPQPWSGCRFSDSRPVRKPVSGCVGGPWVTLRSPTAKSLRLSPSGSRLSGDKAA